MRSSSVAFASSFLTHMRLTLSRPTFQIAVIAQPLVLGIISYMLYAQSRTPGGFIAFVVLGSGVAGIWSSIAYSSSGDINRERAYGTLEPLLCSASSLFLVMCAKVLANGLLSVLAFLVSVVFALLVFKIPFSIAYPWQFVLSFVLFLVATNLFALMLSSIFLLSRSTAVLQNFLEYPVLIVTGCLFPVTVLPVWLQVCGWPIPLTWGVQLLRWSVQGQAPLASFQQALSVEVGLAVLYFVISLLLFRIIEYRIRVTASMEAY